MDEWMGWRDRWMDGWMDEQMNSWTDGWMDGWIDLCLDGQMDLCFDRQTDRAGYRTIGTGAYSQCMGLMGYYCHLIFSYQNLNYT